MRTDRRKLMVSSRKNDMYELLGKALRFHPYIDNSYSKLISSWDTSKVTDLSYCFQGCSYLHSLDLSSWDTSKVTDLSYCFQECSYLQSLDLSSWDTSKLQSLRYTFSNGVNELIMPELGEDNMLNDLYCTWYQNYGIKKLDLSKFNTKNVTEFGWCFDGAIKLEWLDISGFDLSSATAMGVNTFFGRNIMLTHLILGEGFGKIKGEAMFDMSSFASLDEESKASFMSLYDRKANGLPNVTLKLKTSYGFSEEQIQSLTNKGYTINLV